MINTASEFIRLRTSDEPEEYRRAAYDAAPDLVWKELIEDFPEMRIWVVHNKTVPTWVIVQLSMDADPAVREAVAMKRKCPPEILHALSTDAQYSVRLTVAGNPRCPMDLLHHLLDDPCEIVVGQARENIARRSPST